MRIRFEQTVDDVIAMQRFTMENSPALRRQLRANRWRARAAIIGMLVAVAAMVEDSTTQAVLFIAAAGALILGLFTSKRAALRAADNAARAMAKEGGKDLYGPQEMWLDDDAFVRRSEFSETRHKWAGVLSLEETEDHAFWYIAASNAYIIPKRRLEEGDAEAFLLRARQLWLAANPDAVTAEAGRATA